MPQRHAAKVIRTGVWAYSQQRAARLYMESHVWYGSDLLYLYSDDLARRETVFVQGLASTIEQFLGACLVQTLDPTALEAAPSVSNAWSVAFRKPS